MKRCIITFLIVLLGAALAQGCRPAATPAESAAALQTPLPDASILPTVPEPVAGTATDPVNTDPAQGSPAPLPWMLETLSVANAGRIAALAQVGEGLFGDVFQVSPDGTLLAVAAAGGMVLYHAADGERAGFLPAPNQIESLAFSPDSRYLAEVHRVPGDERYTSTDLASFRIQKPILTVWDLESGGQAYSQDLSGRGCGQYAAWDLAYSPDGSTIAFRDFYSLLGHDRTDNLCLLSAVDGALLRTLPVEEPWQSASPLAFSPDGGQLLVAVTDRASLSAGMPLTRVRIYDTAGGGLLRELDGLGSVNDLDLSLDGSTLALAVPDGMRLLSIADGAPLAVIPLPDGVSNGQAQTLAFSPDGAALALGFSDGTAGLWSIAAGGWLWQAPAWDRDPAIYTGETGNLVWDVAFSPDGQMLFVLSPTHVFNASGRVSVYRVTDGEELFYVSGANTYGNPALSPDGRLLAMPGYDDGRVQMWSTAQNRLLFELKGHERMVVSADFSPDGKQLATAGLDGSVRLWQVQDGAPLAELTGHTGPVRAVRYAPGGERLASLGEDAVLRIWDANGGALLQSFETGTGDMLAQGIVFAPDGRSVLLVYGCPYSNCPAVGAGELRHLDLEGGRTETLLPYMVSRASFSADLYAFGIQGDQGIQSGRAEGSQYRAQVDYVSPMGTGALSGAGLSPDGALFFSGNGFGLHVWDAATGQMLALREGSRLPYGVMQVTPDGRLLVVAQPDGLVSLWGVVEN